MAMLAIENKLKQQVGKNPTIRQSDIFEFRSLSDMDLFMFTFDQAPTLEAEWNKWETFAKRNKVEEREVGDQDLLIISFIGLSPYMKDPFNKADMLAYVYEAGCYMHGGEKEYIDFLFFLLQ